MLKITKTVARKVLATVDAGLSHGLGNPKPGSMCVEAAVCFALGLPHGDDPKCVLPALRSFKISLNDKRWSSNAARAKGLRRLALAQLGSDVLDEADFRNRLVTETIRQIVPRALRSAIKRQTNSAHIDAMEAAAVACEAEPTRANAREAQKAAAAAADAAAAAAAAAYAAYAAAAAIRDRELAFAAEMVVQILVAMKASGCRFLTLAPLEAA